MDTEVSSAKAGRVSFAERARLREGIERALLLKWQDVPNEPVTVLAVFMAVWAGVVLTNGLFYPWLTSAFDDTPILALTDPTLYKRDFYIQEMLQFTPRFYYQRMVAAVTLTVGSMVTAQAFFGFVTNGVSVLALLALGRALKIGVVASGALAFLMLTVASGTLGNYFQIVTLVTPTPAAMAGAIMACGLPFLVKRRWNWAFFFFALSCLLQVLVGLFAMLLAAPALLIDVHRAGWAGGKRLLVPTMFGAVGVGAVIGPIWLSQTSGSSLISAREFVQIFARNGFPFHILPSAWPADMWLGATLFYAGGLTFLRTTGALSRSWLLALYFAVAIGAACIVFNALGTSWFPMSAAVKLHLPRATPYTQAAVLIGLSVAFGAAIFERRFFAAAVLAASASIPMAGAALLVIARYWRQLCAIRGLRGHGKHFIALLVGLLAMSSLLSIDQFSTIVLRAIRKTGLFLALILPALIFAIESSRRRASIAIVLATSLWLSMGVALARAYPSPLQAVFDRLIRLDESRIKDPYDLARIVRTETPKDALFVVPPQFMLFRLIAQRAVVADIGTFPHTDAGILEWRRRVEALLDQPFVGTWYDRTLVEEWYRGRPLAELLTVARSFDADYVVTHERWHHPAPEDIAYRAGPWVCVRTFREGVAP